LSRGRLLIVAAAVGALLIAVGAISALTRDPKRTFVLPRCARPAHSIRPPRPFPHAMPLPRGTVFSTLGRYPRVIVLAGRTPLALIPATRFFVRELPRRGFRLGTGESEPGLEAEGGFTGHGILGRFKVRILPRCRGASLLVVSIARDTGTTTTTTTTPTAGGALPACAGANRSVPSRLPRSFPLPAGTIVRSSQKQTIDKKSFDFVAAVAPGTIDDAALFILHRLPKAGYHLAGADRETTEAEGAFAGHGVHGRIRFHTLLACDGVLTIDVAILR